MSWMGALPQGTSAVRTGGMRTAELCGRGWSGVHAARTPRPERKEDGDPEDEDDQGGTPRHRDRRPTPAFDANRAEVGDRLAEYPLAHAAERVDAGEQR